jgi:predicted transcriptional regulator
MQTLTLKMPPELSDWLDKRARELNRPKSEIVRQALLAQRDRKNFESAAARAGDLVGKYAGSKHSSHKRNLKGFGSCNRI